MQKLKKLFFLLMIFCATAPSLSFSAPLRIDQLPKVPFWPSNCLQEGGTLECKRGTPGPIFWKIESPGGGSNCGSKFSFDTSQYLSPTNVIDTTLCRTIEEAGASAAAAMLTIPDSIPTRSKYCSVEFLRLGSEFGGDQPEAGRNAAVSALLGRSAPYQYGRYTDQNGIAKFQVVTRDAYGNCLPPTLSENMNAGWVRASFCEPGWKASSQYGVCVRPMVDCCIRPGNPIDAGTGSKIQTEMDFAYASSSELQFIRTYKSQGFFESADVVNPTSIGPPLRILGNHWRHNYQRQIIQSSPNGIVAVKKDGSHIVFKGVGGSWTAPQYRSERLVQLFDGAVANGWVLTSINDSIEIYDNAGKLISIKTPNGKTQDLSYTDGTALGDNGSVAFDNGSVLPAGLLLRVTDQAGRSINFKYLSNTLLAQVIEPNGNVTAFSFDKALHLKNVKRPDERGRTYIYYAEELTPVTGQYDELLTGIIDENGIRSSTYTYDQIARATSTQLANGANKYVVTYPWTSELTGSSLNISITDPLGTIRSSKAVQINGVYRNGGETQPCISTNCSGNVSTNILYDTNGNVASRTDFNGTVTTYTYDLSRSLETSRVEASGTANARTITTAWHPTYRLPLTISDPLRRTTYTYDSNGNQLSKTIQATSDATGAQGVSGAAVGAPRTWSNSYNNFGQVLTTTGPRTDLVDVTSYAYDTMGNLISITNALNQVTTLSNYDLNGRVGRITDSNGTVTDMSYSPRGWLTSKSIIAGSTTETTSYSYDGVGQLINVTLPDASSISYTYDPAHRLTNISDSAGNSIVYTLDAMGNRINEQIKDPSGQLARQTTRVVDALNRVQQITGLQ